MGPYTKVAILWVAAALVGCGTSGPDIPEGCGGDQVLLPAVRDTTLYGSQGDISNETGDHLFAGTTKSGEIRRALVAFDIDSRVSSCQSVADLAHRLREPLTALRLDIEAPEDREATAGLEEDADELERTVNFMIEEARRPVWWFSTRDPASPMLLLRREARIPVNQPASGSISPAALPRRRAVACGCRPMVAAVRLFSNFPPLARPLGPAVEANDPGPHPPAGECIYLEV